MSAALAAVPLIGAGISAVGGILGQVLSGKSREEAAAILNSVRDSFGRIDPVKVKQLHAEHIQLDPESAGRMGDSERRLDASIEAGGMTIEDQAALDEALEDTGRQDRAQRAHIQASFDARGAGGSSQNLLAQLVNQQGSAQRAHRQGMTTAADASRRYWQNVREKHQMAGQTADRKSAIDRWNRGADMDAQRYNNSLESDRWDRDFRTKSAQAGVAGQQAAAKVGDAQRTAAMWGGVGNAVGQGVSQAGADEEERRRRREAMGGK